jgi:hypothetical protein
MAMHFGISEAGVHHWKVGGVPKGRMKDVRDFTGGCVSLEEMLPDQTLKSMACGVSQSEAKPNPKVKAKAV